MLLPRAAVHNHAHSRRSAHRTLWCTLLGSSIGGVKPEPSRDAFDRGCPAERRHSLAWEEPVAPPETDTEDDDGEYDAAHRRAL